MDDIEMNPRILSALKRANIVSFKAVLSLSPADLERRTRLPANDVATLLQTVSAEVYKHPSATVLEMYQGTCHESLQTAVLSTGCPVLDEFLRGGILSHGITEIAGESAAGKTQLCMQLCLSVQRSRQKGGLGGGAVYICTEDVFPSKRLQQLINNFQKTPGTDEGLPHLGDNIYIEHVSERDQLAHCMQYRIPALLRQVGIKLLVVDSLASLFRCEFTSAEAAIRAQHLQNLGAHLNSLGRQHGVTVVCVNQVTANMRNSSSKQQQQRQHIPALGLAWSNVVQTRLMLGRTHYRLPASDNQLDVAGGTAGDKAGIPVRSLEVVFAPHLPNETCYFVVEAGGVRGLR